MKHNLIIDEINDKYGEWIEMAGDKAPAVIMDILCQLLAKERELNEYYRRRLDHVSVNSTK